MYVYVSNENVAGMIGKNRNPTSPNQNNLMIAHRTN